MYDEKFTIKGKNENYREVIMVSVYVRLMLKLGEIPLDWLVVVYVELWMSSAMRFAAGHYGSGNMMTMIADA